MEAGQIFGIVIGSVTMAALLVLSVIGAIFDAKEKREKQEIRFADLKGDIIRLENELRKQKDYFEARIFLGKFKWTDIKNERLRKQTQKMLEAYEKMPLTIYSYEQAYIDKAEAIMKALDKDAEITRYTEKENKIKRSIKK